MIIDKYLRQFVVGLVVAIFIAVFAASAWAGPVYSATAFGGTYLGSCNESENVKVCKADLVSGTPVEKAYTENRTNPDGSRYHVSISPSGEYVYIFRQ